LSATRNPHAEFARKLQLKQCFPAKSKSQNLAAIQSNQRLGNTSRRTTYRRFNSSMTSLMFNSRHHGMPLKNQPARLPA
jgi:hypothetical protein